MAIFVKFADVRVGVSVRRLVSIDGIFHTVLLLSVVIPSLVEDVSAFLAKNEHLLTVKMPM